MKQLMENWRKLLAEWDEDDTEHFDDLKSDNDYTAAGNFKMGDVVKVMNRGTKHDEPEELRCRVGTVTGMEGTDLTLKFDNGEEATIGYYNAARDEYDLWNNKNLYGGCAAQVNEDCWDGYERVPGSKEGAPGSCRKKTNDESCDDDKEELDERDAGMEVWMEKFKLHMRLAQNQPMDDFMKDNAMYAYRRGMDPKQAAEELRRATAERDFPESGMELYDIDEDQIDEASICKAGKDWVDGKTIGGQKVSRGEDGKFNNWSARAAQIASKYCKDPNYGRGKKKKKNESMSEGDLGDWEKENWTHSDGTPCGGGDKDGSQSRCKPASKWKGMSKGEKAADNAKKKAGTDAGKQYVSATKKGKVTKAHTKEAQVADILAQLFEGCGEPAPVDYDHGPEASMHRSSLHTIKGEVEQLLYMIGEQDDLPEWLEAKITKAKAYLSAAKDYLSGEQAEMAGALEEQLADAIVVEYLEEDNMDEGGRCTKATEKTTSTRKGKKYMKCIKNPDGEGYIRKHWGQKGARAAPKGSKRNKSFNKRHKCSTAKAGTARKLACDDW